MNLPLLKMTEIILFNHGKISFSEDKKIASLSLAIKARIALVLGEIQHILIVLSKTFINHGINRHVYILLFDIKLS